ncbi:hypothetical protein [Tenacibaculum sp. M341]|uniref:hypothetical protein n=1 Tax=Tenacibaculum sp. M341 TaxID=2530339 RepID=UPI00104F0520|nr:hypothetical protein [Tenacibaculum sp. M341]TCI93568.1 hypothetical protein EYW44_03935 [Tenacibaculum sp. M341]
MKYTIEQKTRNKIKNVTVKRIARCRPIIEIENHTSLGPFVRVTQSEQNKHYVYVLAYFNRRVKNFIIRDESFPTIYIVAGDKSTNIKKKKQDLLCFIIELKDVVCPGDRVDIEIDFNQKMEGGVGEPTRGTVATPPVKD